MQAHTIYFWDKTPHLIILFPANAAMLTPAVFVHQEIAAAVRVEPVIYGSSADSADWGGRFGSWIVW